MSSTSDLVRGFWCSVQFLDDTPPQKFYFRRDDVGQKLLDQVFAKLNLVEKGYFGMRYVDNKKQRHWLDPGKLIIKQLRGCSPFLMTFRVKYYPLNPSNLKEEITRYLMFLQVRKDLLHGRLLCTLSQASFLGSLIVQATLGDYNNQCHLPGYEKEFRIIPRQDDKFYRLIASFHQNETKGLSASYSEKEFLMNCTELETYGVDPHPAKDRDGVDLYIGLTHYGIEIFDSTTKLVVYDWIHVEKIHYEKRKFHIHFLEVENGVKKHCHYIFCLPKTRACKHLWKSALEHQAFFTARCAKEVPVKKSGSILRRATLRFRGNTMRELVADQHRISRKEPIVDRSPASFKRDSILRHSTTSLKSDSSETSPTRKDLRSDFYYLQAYDSSYGVDRETASMRGGVNMSGVSLSSAESFDSGVSENAAETIASRVQAILPDLTDEENNAEDEVFVETVARVPERLLAEPDDAGTTTPGDESATHQRRGVTFAPDQPSLSNGHHHDDDDDDKRRSGTTENGAPWWRGVGGRWRQALRLGFLVYVVFLANAIILLVALFEADIRNADLVVLRDYLGSDLNLRQFYDPPREWVVNKTAFLFKT